MKIIFCHFLISGGGKKNGNQNGNKNGNKMCFGSVRNEFYGKSRVSFEVCFFSLVSENFIHEQ
jgi:hypothetical protein